MELFTLNKASTSTPSIPTAILGTGLLAKKNSLARLSLEKSYDLRLKYAS
jgi:hypothetical protein